MRFVYLFIAIIALSIAAIGIILPGLPATEFFILAAWASGKSSPRLHNWMLAHPVIGPPIKNWQLSGIVSLKVKIISCISMTISAIFVVLTIDHLLSVVIILLGMLVGAMYLLTRPSQI